MLCISASKLRANSGCECSSGCYITSNIVCWPLFCLQMLKWCQQMFKSLIQFAHRTYLMWFMCPGSTQYICPAGLPWNNTDIPSCKNSWETRWERGLMLSKFPFCPKFMYSFCPDSLKNQRLWALNGNNPTSLSLWTCLSAAVSNQENYVFNGKESQTLTV